MRNYHISIYLLAIIYFISTDGGQAFRTTADLNLKTLVKRLVTK